MCEIVARDEKWLDYFEKITDGLNAIIYLQDNEDIPILLGRKGGTILMVSCLNNYSYRRYLYFHDNANTKYYYIDIEDDTINYIEEVPVLEVKNRLMQKKEYDTYISMFSTDDTLRQYLLSKNDTVNYLKYGFDFQGFPEEYDISTTTEVFEETNLIPFIVRDISITEKTEPSPTIETSKLKSIKTRWKEFLEGKFRRK